MKNVLITGGTGFLGSHIIKKMLQHDDYENIVVLSTSVRYFTTFKLLNIESEKISFVKGDVRDYAFLQNLFNEYDFETSYTAFPANGSVSLYGNSHSP